MKFETVSPGQFELLFPQSLTPYGSVRFNDLNAYKTGAVRYVCMKDSKDKPRLGASFGIIDRRASDPFSAPFGEIRAKGEQKLETVDYFCRGLKDVLEAESIKLVLPPGFYGMPMMAKFEACLSAICRESYRDMNYHYCLDDFPDFIRNHEGNARSHYNKAVASGFSCRTCRLDEAYDVIQKNRAEHGYPLRMTLSDLQSTSHIITIDSFIIELSGAPVAAAIVYRLTDRIAQVIYWGDIAEYRKCRPMNLLSEKVFSFYSRQNFDIVDLGPSSSDGVPDMGLSTFKESLGCRLTFKPTFIL